MKKTATRSWSRVYHALMVAPPVTFIPIPVRLHAQTARIMKMFVVFLLAATFSAYGHGTAQTITLSGRHLDLKQVFSVIEKQTGYVVFYRQDQLTHTKPLNLQVSNMPLREFLDTVLSQQQLDFRIRDKTIILLPQAAPAQEKVVWQLLPAEAAPINILVMDDAGLPLQGANVSIKDKKEFAVTDVLGTCKIKADEGDEITITYIGQENRVIKVTKAMLKNGTVVAMLQASTTRLGSVEVVVNTGYQRIRPERSTGAVSQISTKDYESRISTNFIDGLENKMPGLMINNNVAFNSTDGNGNKSSRSLFNIRGISTMSANQNPLIVIDGYPTELTMDMIDPNEIKSVTILKDAAAATIYGVRASNGVIVIERKQARAGKPRFSFRATAGITPKPDYSRYRWEDHPGTTVINYQKDLNKTSISNSTWSQLINKSSYSGVAYSPVYYILAQQAAGIITPYQAEKSLQELENYDNTNDYSKLFLRSAQTQTYSLDISGGNPGALYYITANYTGNRLNTLNNNNNRLSLSGRSTIKLSQKLSLELSTDYQEQRYNSAPVPDIYAVYPFEHFKDVNGKPTSIASGSGGNPYYDAELLSWGLQDNLAYPLIDVNEIGDKTRTVNNRITAKFNYAIGWGFDLSFGGIYETSRSDMRHYASEKSSEAKQYVNSYITLNADGTLKYNIPNGGFLRQETNNTSSYTARVQLNYNKKLGALHTINGILGAEIRSVLDKSNLASYFGYNDETLLQQPVNLADMINGTISGAYINTRSIRDKYDYLYGQGYAENRYLSGYANVVYAFKSTYSLTGSIRIDQSNLFGTNPKYKYKPLWSLGAAWNIHNEKFMQDITWVKQLKLRVADGFNGNVAKMSLPQAIAMTVLNAYTSPTSPALTKLSYANSSLRWEQTHNFNVGLDYILLKNISGSIDYYRKTSTDLLGNAQIDPTIGESPTLINTASIRNKGIELSLHADWIATKKINWNTGLVLSRNISKVTDVYQTGEYSPQRLNYLGYVKGYPVGAMFAYRYAGLDSAGIPLIKNTKGTLYHTNDSKLGSATSVLMTSDTSGVTAYMGSSIPTINAGLSNRVDIGNFYLYCMISYYGGFKTSIPRPNPTSIRPQKDAGSYWKQAGDENNTNIMSLAGYSSYNALNAYNYADAYVVNGGYITLSDLTLSYSLDNYAVIRNAGFTHFELKLQASNLWTKGLNDYNYSAATGTYQKSYITPTYTIGIFTNF
ncbi:TonB-linked outer membrane protein, SusC/RagA family [Chitinophaga sancti]|uniref:TonB-linked outer membrane protein, SusC/RagA family n=2 Tax=Chitinophaga sancti TaxID=1004 RepID=A0A1K1SJA1_9BACT|nr:TonB-linked outer membrane protein, SusC/RagA family [Chitinophaga sancti]